MSLSYEIPYDMELDMIVERRERIEEELKSLDEGDEEDLERIKNLNRFDDHLQERIVAIRQKVSELHDWYGNY